MELGLGGRVALITGGSEGIGKAIAWRLAEAGCKVAICARRSNVLESAAEEIRSETCAEVMAVPADVTKWDDIERFVSATVEAFGRIDNLINNAGRAAGGYFEDVDEVAWQGDMDLKFWAAVRFCRLVVPLMREQGGGRIINITHPGGKAPGAGSVPTSVSRAAGIAFTKALSHDVAKHNILVNTVCLTNIKSAQGVRWWQESGTEMSLSDWWVEQGKTVPVGRAGEPEEVGDLVAFLASERASFITGASINIDGGTSAVV